jgi:hypothetical protein
MATGHYEAAITALEATVGRPGQPSSAMTSTSDH